MYCYVYLRPDNYVCMAVWCRGLHGMRLPWNSEESSGWAFLWKHWDPWGLSHDVYWESCDLILCNLFVLDLQLWLCLVYGHTILLWYHTVIGFPWFSSWFLLILAFCVLRTLGISWEKRKVSGAWGELCGTQ